MWRQDLGIPACCRLPPPSGVTSGACVADGTDWAGWTQAAVGAVAILTAPSAITALVRRFKFPFIAESRPIGETTLGLSRAWTVEIHSRNSHARDLTFQIYPDDEGNSVLSVKRITTIDGGHDSTASIAEGGCLEVSIKRLMKGRSLEYAIRFAKPALPTVAGFNVGIRHGIYQFERDFREREQSPNALELIKYRAMIVMLQMLGALVD